MEPLGFEAASLFSDMILLPYCASQIFPCWELVATFFSTASVLQNLLLLRSVSNQVQPFLFTLDPINMEMTGLSPTHQPVPLCGSTATIQNCHRIPWYRCLLLKFSSFQLPAESRFYVVRFLRTEVFLLTGNSPISGSTGLAMSLYIS